MLTAEENDRLTRVGRGTPMGELVRRFWLPFLQVSDIAEPDGAPVRVTLLGEQLVAFRDTSGRIGLIDRLCAHRCANLFFGRNEENGLRCTYHGWKYNVGRKVRRHANGRCGEHFQGQYPAYRLSRAGESRDPVDLHGTQGSNPGAARI